MSDSIDRDLRVLLSEATGLPPQTVGAMPDDTPLLDGQLGISSRAGAQLLLAVEQRFGVDVASEDLALTSLASIGSLARFVKDRTP